MRAVGARRLTALLCLGAWITASPSADAAWLEADARLQAGVTHGVGGTLWDEIAGPGAGMRLGIEALHVDFFAELDRARDDRYFSLLGIGFDLEFDLGRMVATGGFSVARVFSALGNRVLSRDVPHQGLAGILEGTFEVPLGVPQLRFGARLGVGMHRLSDGLVGQDGDWGAHFTGMVHVRAVGGI